MGLGKFSPRAGIPGKSLYVPFLYGSLWRLNFPRMFFFGSLYTSRCISPSSSLGNIVLSTYNRVAVHPQVRCEQQKSLKLYKKCVRRGFWGRDCTIKVKNVGGRMAPRIFYVLIAQSGPPDPFRTQLLRNFNICYLFFSFTGLPGGVDNYTYNCTLGSYSINYYSKHVCFIK